jgi:hypothetical protein
MRRVVLIGAALLATSGTACGGTSQGSIPAPSISPTASHSAVAARAHRAATSNHPPFRWHGSHVTAASLGKSWHSGCPVGPDQLRKLSLTYWGFDHAAHQGHLVVRGRVVPDIVSAFQAMYKGRFPIRRMRPISVYDGDDNRSMRHDNTSAFNCRYAVSSGPKHWSMHAYGEAVDINTVENPYYLNGRVHPKKGEPYLDRSNVRPGMVVSGSVPLNAFSRLGWGWGGNWSDSPDYQHFSTTGG